MWTGACATPDTSVPHAGYARPERRACSSDSDHDAPRDAPCPWDAAWYRHCSSVLWPAACWSQATDRAFRIGQTSPRRLLSGLPALRTAGGFALANRIGRATVSCQPRDLDRYGRIVAVCFKGNEDLNRWMVANGWAVAYKQYSLDYVADEVGAHRSQINIWSGEFEMPWDWRLQHRHRRGNGPKNEA